VMDKDLYEQEGLRQLLDPHYYREIDNTIAAETVSEINEIIDNLEDIRYITEDQHNYIKTLVPEKPRSFYLLPKVHKDRGKWPHPRMPEGRPIVADYGSETDRICEFIDYFLKPLSTGHPSYIKDTYHFVSKIRGEIIPDSAFLVTGDVTALYTRDGLKAVLSRQRRGKAAMSLTEARQRARSRPRRGRLNSRQGRGEATPEKPSFL